jgi:ubiquinone/menaquinone biosynthesis C-methylase UbiE
MTTPPSPLATPLAWNLVAAGYAADNLEHFKLYSADALALADVKPRERILDVACGPGALTLQVAPIASEVHALDFAAEMLAQLRANLEAHGLDNVIAREGDGQALPYEDAQFDAAFSMFGLMFFPERGRGFRELFRVVRPGGRAVVSSWQPLQDAPVLTALMEALAAELPNVPFGDGKGPLSDREDLQREMSEAGFAVEIVERTHDMVMPSIDAAWDSLRRSFAPLRLLEHKLGPVEFARVATGIEQRMRARFSGPQRNPMPAWLALGRKV